MIFELPFDLIVMHRIFPPMSEQFTLLFFLPLFLVEISSLSLLTLLPRARVSKFTLFSLTAMFFIFAVWALFGFSILPAQYPLPSTRHRRSSVSLRPSRSLYRMRWRHELRACVRRWVPRVRASEPAPSGPGARDKDNPRHPIPNSFHCAV